MAQHSSLVQIADTCQSTTCVNSLAWSAHSWHISLPSVDSAFHLPLPTIPRYLVGYVSVSFCVHLCVFLKLRSFYPCAAGFSCVWCSFFNTSSEIVWEEHPYNDMLNLRWDVDDPFLSCCLKCFVGPRSHKNWAFFVSSPKVITGDQTWL